MNKPMIALLAGLSLVSSSFVAAEECSRAPRKANFEDAPVRVYIGPNASTEVAFPETTLEGARPEKPEGLIFSRTKIPSKLNFSAEDEIYHGLVLIHGTSGRTYMLNLLSRPNCPDTFVQLVEPEALEPERVASVQQQPSRRPKGLIDYLIDHPADDELPINYRAVKFKGPKEDRKVFEMASLTFYMHKQWVSEQYVGTILEVVNNGRTPFRVDIQNIDYSDPTIREVFGRVRAITMNPFDFRLGPSPEFVSEIYNTTNRGYIYIVSEKVSNG